MVSVYVKCRVVLVLFLDEIVLDELLQSLKVLSVQFHVIVPSPLNPEGFHGFRTLLVDGETVGEVDHFVFRAVDDENR